MVNGTVRKAIHPSDVMEMIGAISTALNERGRMLKEYPDWESKPYINPLDEMKSKC